MYFQVAYPVYWLLASALLALGASYFLYRNNPLKFEKKWMTYGISSLRFFTLFLICFLLLKPLVKWVSRQKQKPILVLAVDNSESMVLNKDSSYYRGAFLTELKEFENNLAQQFDVKTYTLGQQPRLNKDITFNEKLSNISDALVQIENDHYNLNHAATALFSDGIYNQGSNPIYALAKGGPPIFTFNLGDTTQHKDALISKVRHNNLVYAGNDFELQVDCKAFYCAGESLQLRVMEGDQQLAQGTLKVIGNNFFGTQKFTLTNAREGIHTYRLRLSSLSKESTLLNNQWELQVNVIKAKQKAILLYLNPHPDIAAMMKSFDGNSNFDLEAHKLADYQEQGINDASLFILHQIPGKRGEGLKLIERLQKNNMPLFFIMGRQSGIPYLPSITGMRINGPADNFNESQAWVNENFGYFTLDEDQKGVFQKLAPLFTPYGNYQLPAEAQVLLYQQIGYVKTNAPLLFFSSSKGSNQAYLCGEGFWKWRMQDYLLNQNQDFTDHLLAKTIQWVAGKSDRSKFRVNPIRKTFDENEPVWFDAELFNDLYEKINDADISLSLKSKKNNYTYQFSKTEKAYQLDMGNLPPGEYRYEAKVLGKQNYPVKTGLFYVKALQTEALQTKANHQMLRALSSETGGLSFQKNQWKELEKELLNNQNMKTVVYETEEMKNLLDQKWLFFLLLFLLTLEWLLRKWNGFI